MDAALNIPKRYINVWINYRVYVQGFKLHKLILTILFRVYCSDFQSLTIAQNMLQIIFYYLYKEGNTAQIYASIHCQIQCIATSIFPLWGEAISTKSNASTSITNDPENGQQTFRTLEFEILLLYALNIFFGHPKLLYGVVLWWTALDK